jgi:hypothetical protein
MESTASSASSAYAAVDLDGQWKLEREAKRVM